VTTDYLFARPSFLRGLARVVDMGGRLNRGAYNRSRSPAHADTKALLSDWQVVADDFASAFGHTFIHAHGVENGREEQGKASS
jgi:hypothetical protein